MFGSEFSSKALPADPESESEYSLDLEDEYHYEEQNYEKRPSPPTERRKRPVLKYLLALAGGLLAYHYLSPAGFYHLPCFRTHDAPQKPPPMTVFQVYPPVRVGKDYLPEETPHSHECSVVLMQHVFAWSYGKPFVGKYEPPQCEWTHVLFNLTMTSEGRQFDRLALMFLGDVEVFRTSTAEPTWYGIEFGYVKDMTAYSSLLRTEQKVIFELGNLVDDRYTGSFNATLVATFYTPPPSRAVLLPPANTILPLSSRSSSKNHPSHYRLPQDTAKNTISLPANTIRALVSISASGNADEEFWYTNVPTAYTETFSTALPGHSPFREIQLLINNELAGVAWPFATIFTGGINPGLWRPIVGIAAFDIPEYEIDITPLLPLLLDRSNTFELKLVSWDPDPTQASAIGSDWLVSARVFIWSDPDGDWNTTGIVHIRSFGEPAFEFNAVLETEGTNKHRRNVSLECKLIAERALSTTSTIVTSAGPLLVSWTQGMRFQHRNVLSTDEANRSTAVVELLTQGVNAGAGAGANTLVYRWPLNLTTSYFEDVENGRFVIEAEVQREVEETRGGATMETRLNGSAVYISTGYANGRTEQRMRFTGVPKDGEGVGMYERWVRADAGKIGGDREVVNGKVVEKEDGAEDGAEGMVFVGGGRTVRGILGRGPG